MLYIYFHFELGLCYIEGLSVPQYQSTWHKMQRHDLWCVNFEDLDASFSPIAVPMGKAQ